MAKAKSDNSALHNARRNKKDEFYTQYSDIEAELMEYSEQFFGKTVYCNCDDPKTSNFTNFFARNFKHFKLKKLICTHFEIDKPAHRLIVERDENGDGIIDENDIIELPLRQNFEQKDEGGVQGTLDIFTDEKASKFSGDFRSPECVELLKEADIVVTNPPFSMFRDYVAQLMEYNKKFLIIGNQNAITYKEIFPLILANRMWLGHSIHSGDREFQVPDSYPLDAAGVRIDEEGNRFIRIKGVRWFTNLDHSRRHEWLQLLTKEQNERMGVVYHKYDNYDAINVDKVAEIPSDYDGVMGVPITFLDKWNPEQFEIVVLIKDADGNDSVYSFNDLKQEKPESALSLSLSLSLSPGQIQTYVKRKKKYARMFIRRLHRAGNQNHRRD
jgi:hypothetical protein